jgi:hypothetical protein
MSQLARAFALTTLKVSVLVAAAPSNAFTVISQPDATYQSTTTLIDISGIASDTAVNSLTDGSIVVSLSSTLTKGQVPTDWGSWSSPPNSQSSTPAVLYREPLKTLNVFLSKPSVTFGFELEPSIFGTYTFSAHFYSGLALVGSISQAIQGYAGARLFAASDSSNPFTSVRIDSSTADPVGFAIAQLRYESAPPAKAPSPLPVWGAVSAFAASRRLRRLVRASNT